MRGLVERVFRVRSSSGQLVSPPVPEPEHFNTTLLPEFRRLVSGLSLRPIPLDQVIGLWTGSKRAVYQRAYDSLRLDQLSRKDGFLSTFVKCEKIDSSKGDPAPRVIQPRSPRYNLHLARFLKPHEHVFYEQVDQMWDTDGLGDRTIFKGLNAKTAADHLVLKSSRYSNPVFVGLDASRFDQHVSAIALGWEHSVYLECFQYGKQELANLLGWQVDNIGLARIPDGRRIKYQVTGRRMSGDMNTSLGNCLIMSSLVHAYLREKGIKGSLANNGDDCVVMIERQHLHHLDDIPTWFRKMGFNMKVEPPVYDLRQVTFCQVNVLTDESTNICVRNPRVVLSKDLHSAYPFTHESQYSQWLSASGICGLTSHGGVPVLQDFYRAFPQDHITDKGVLTELERWNKYSIVGGTSESSISDGMRHSMWVAFGILPDAQVALEHLYKRIRFGTALGSVDSVPYAAYFQGTIPDKNQHTHG